MKLLVVDDHILFRQGLVSMLEQHGNYEIIGEAGSVKEAVLPVPVCAMPSTSRP